MGTKRLLAADLTRNHWNETTAGRVLATWRESAMSLSGFAHANGLSAERLRRWGKRLGRGAEAEAAGDAPMRFVPAVVNAAAGAVVRLPGGVELEGDVASVPADWVAALARALVKA